MTNLPIKSNNTFFNRIKNWFKSLFYKKSPQYAEINNNAISEEQESKGNEQNDYRNKFKEELKPKANQKLSIEEIRKTVENNPELLNKISLKHLKEIEKYYDKLIAQESGNFKFTNKEDIRLTIENKPELINVLSLAQLKILENYYDNLILMSKKQM